MYIIKNNINIDEIKEINKLEEEIFCKKAYSIAQIEEMKKDKNYTIVLVEKLKNIIGYIILFDNSESMEIMKIAVKEKYRNKTIGKILINKSKELKKDIFLEVRENNIIAIEFYKKNKFIEIGKRKGYYQDTKEAAILMKYIYEEKNFSENL